MKPGRRHFIKLAGASVAAPAISRIAWGQAPQVTLRLHHFLSPVSNGHVRFLTPWVKKVESESGGRIRIEIFPSMQLGGTPPRLYDQARDGTADIVWALPGNTPGRFPTIETFELPFVAARKAIANSRAVQDFAQEHLKDEFREVHPICFWAHDHGLVHTNKPIRTLEDLRGLKIRFPTRLSGEALKALGANPIGMPIPQVPEALAQRAIDGCVMPWEVVPAVKVQELVKFHTEIPGSPTLYTTTFVLAMNKAKYGSLPADLKKVIDANSGTAAASMAGNMWDQQAAAVSDMVAKRGNTITALEAGEVARWRKATAPVTAAWFKAMKEQGHDGGALLFAARALVTKYENA